jgi:hypothetical protein
VRALPSATRVLSLWIALLLLQGCAGPPPEDTLVLLGSENRVFLILPFNVAARMPTELEGLSPVVWKQLELYLREQGKQLKTVSRESARALWLRAIKELRQGGSAAAVGYDDAARVLARELRKHAEFDAMIAPSLYLREAAISRRWARWDGVERELEIEARGLAARSVAGAALQGAAPAASIHVTAFGAGGEKLHESLGGLELLVRVRVAAKPSSGTPSFQFATRTDLFANTEHVREGIDVAFVPFLPSLLD